MDLTVTKASEDRPSIIMPNGVKVTITKPVWFAGHPAVPRDKVKPQVKS